MSSGIFCVCRRTAEAGIQMYLKFLDPASRYAGLDPGLPGIDESCCCVLLLSGTIFPFSTAEFTSEKIRYQTPRLFGEIRVVTVAVRHRESVSRTMEEMPVQRLSVRLKTCH